MKKISKILFCMCLGMSTYAVAETNALVELDDVALGQIEGQAGVDLSLRLSLNQGPDYSFDKTVCQSDALQYCRLAINFNNRYDDGSNDTYDTNGVRQPSTTGKKVWLTFKGIQGTIIVDKLGLDGADVAFATNGAAGTTYRAALNFSFDPNKPIQVRNFGFQSLSIETDTLAQEAGEAGYLNNTTYTDAVNKFDGYNPDTGVGRETGFLGLNMNANIALTGSIKMFSCLDHGRCQ